MIVSNGNVTITEAVWLEIVEDSKQRTDELNDRIRVLEAALRDAKEATQALRIVGDDYPGSSCHEWCHAQADAADIKARYP